MDEEREKEKERERESVSKGKRYAYCTCISMDLFIRVSLQLTSLHLVAVRDVKWSQQGHFLLFYGYDCTSRLIDVKKGLETPIFREDQIVGVIKFGPFNSNIFFFGGSKAHIKLWDIRNGKAVHNYNQNLGSILDVEFTMNGKQFISSSDVSGSNANENSIIVWDVSRQVPLSNQLSILCPNSTPTIPVKQPRPPVGS
ncbi:hypothetical protein RJT34_30265 [Clitoria ternatea]|uniref:Uncharacterized protein n=1 Tax=Clitoria ternatea TaxID=43366 RepID=A0AAN9I2H1_CLITE